MLASQGTTPKEADMTAAVKAIPEGYHTVTPYLILNAAGDAIAFYQKALGAEEVLRMEDPGGKVHHAEIKIGDSRILLADEDPFGYRWFIATHKEDLSMDEIRRRAATQGR